MKKKLLAIFYVALSGLLASAQTVQFGIKAGPQQNVFLAVTAGQSSNSLVLTKLGFHAGFLADIKVKSSFSIQPQLLYIAKGGEEVVKNGFLFSTIDLPVNFLWHYEGFFAGAGPNFSYVISASGIAAGKKRNLFTDSLTKASFHTKHLEMGANFCMGYQFPGGFMLSVSYTPGFSSIFKPVDPQNGNTYAKAHNSFFGFSLGHLLQKTGK